MMDYQYRRKALQNLQDEKNLLQTNINKFYKKKRSILAKITSWITFTKQ